MWGICYLFPFLNSSPWYSSMLLAWSTTEVIRYSFFTFKQVGLNPPSWLLWLRYSSFTILYPIGISSEVVMIIKAIMGPAASFAPWYPYVLGAILVAYVPCKTSSPLLCYCFVQVCRDLMFARHGRLHHALQPHAQAATKAAAPGFAEEEQIGESTRRNGVTREVKINKS